jgi:pantetheine-phosphate adenylyltransferase
MTDHRRRTAIYPGSFDPLTMGHVNIVHRALALFGRVVVATLRNPGKQGMFTVAERCDLIREVFDGVEGVEVDSFDGLLVDYVRRRDQPVVIRGLRAVQDFEYEFQMTMMNRRLAPEIDTVFVMTDEDYFYIASRTVKEVASLGGDITGLVPPSVQAAMFAKLAEMKK